jgi:hypothetical protein
MAQLDSRSLTEFLLSGSWSDSRRLLVLHPEFLDPATDELVEGLIATRRQNGDELQAKVLEQQLGLLRRCRQVGVDAAFAELSGQPRTFVMEEPEAVRRQAEDAQRHYERTGDVRSLEVAVDLWFRVYMDLDDPSMLRRVSTAFEEAIGHSPSGSVLHHTRSAALGVTRLRLYNLTRDPDDLVRSIHALEQSLPDPPPRSPDIWAYVSALMDAVDRYQQEVTATLGRTRLRP